MPSADHLFIIASNYPYGFSEPFLEAEMRYLATRFDHIHIVTTEPCVMADQHFVLPSNAEVSHANINIPWVVKLINIWRFFSDKVIREEMSGIREIYGGRLTIGKLKTLLVARLRALSLYNNLKEKIGLYTHSSDRVFLYSYWCSEFAHSLALVKKEEPNITAFTRAHGWDLYFERSKYDYLPLRMSIFETLDAIFPISENGRNYLLSKFDQQIDESKVVSSRLGINTGMKNDVLHRRFRKFRIVSCSNLISIKRVDLLVRSLARINDLEISWIHFGEGDQMIELQLLTQKLLSPKKNITFEFRGRVPNWELLSFYAENEIDLFVTVSKWDGIPVSLMEAMSFGIPTVATNVGGVSEIVLNDENANSVLPPFAKRQDNPDK